MSADTGAALRRLWADVLGVEEVGPLDDFFDLGGDSILLLQVLARSGEVGVELELDRLGEFLEEATCVRLLELTGHGAGAAGGAPPEPGITAITLRAGNEATNVFVLLPTLHDLWAVRELSAQLEDASIHVLVPEWSPSRPYQSVPALGEAVVATIGALQPRPPYRIVGSCAAGLVALEAASRLAGTGRSVDLLALVDTQPPRRRPRTLPLHRLLAIRPGSWGVPPELFSKLMWLDLLRASTPLSPDQLMRHLWDAVRAHIDDLLRFIVEVEPERWTDAYSERAARTFMSWLNYQLASEAYWAPPPYGHRVTMLCSDEPGDDCVQPVEAAREWTRLTGGACDLETFDAGHTSAIMSNPVVARVVRRSLRPPRSAAAQPPAASDAILRATSRANG